MYFIMSFIITSFNFQNECKKWNYSQTAYALETLIFVNMKNSPTIYQSEWKYENKRQWRASSNASKAPYIDNPTNPFRISFVFPSRVSDRAV